MWSRALAEEKCETALSNSRTLGVLQEATNALQTTTRRYRFGSNADRIKTVLQRNTVSCRPCLQDGGVTWCHTDADILFLVFYS